MSDIKDGGPAFPGQMPTGFDPRSGNYFEGMTLRDWFAGQAACGYCSREDSIRAHYDAIAADAYGIADAMLEARKEGAQ